MWHRWRNFQIKPRVGVWLRGTVLPSMPKALGLIFSNIHNNNNKIGFLRCLTPIKPQGRRHPSQHNSNKATKSSTVLWLPTTLLQWLGTRRPGPRATDPTWSTAPSRLLFQPPRL